MTGVPAVGSDLTTRSAVHDLVVEFYREVILDDLLGPVFDDAAEVDWAVHIPKLVDYWCRILLGEPSPPLRTVPAHRALHALVAIRSEHCDRWWELWSDAIDRQWCGPAAEHAKDHAAALMSGLARRVFGFEWAHRDRSARSAERPAGAVPSG